MVDAAISLPNVLRTLLLLVASCLLWGDVWAGNTIYLFCDNDAVIEVLDKEKPKDSKMQDLLREFLYIVCLKKFTPVFRKISTKSNEVADFISRCHDPASTADFFRRKNLPLRRLVTVPDVFFELNSNW